MGDEQKVGVAKLQRRYVAALEARVRELEEALEYYAKCHTNPNDGPWGVYSTDFGNVARAVLAKGKT